MRVLPYNLIVIAGDKHPVSVVLVVAATSTSFLWKYANMRARPCQLLLCLHLAGFGELPRPVNNPLNRHRLKLFALPRPMPLCIQLVGNHGIAQALLS